MNESLNRVNTHSDKLYGHCMRLSINSTKTLKEIQYNGRHMGVILALSSLFNIMLSLSI